MSTREAIDSLKGYHEATKRRIKEECKERLELEDVRFTWDLKKLLKKVRRLTW